ncbi:ssDNA-binding Zn-finger/Zn-ribbon topoisomerase 1 [Rahnella sp. BIGb0603]|uniref:ogr/Delta-like zinc finger family protein n=1 Tax=Rahnella sp. BIGb0603 TaxID=2940612 RepID=UPI002169B7A1|nr:ogr/Delta-like zinc finger family protein [Rahnella sp. BIGb0603]MCS3425029.1 ssDNA-binding Zn-finger/Zn-ribbon topoisomerase 1 [Rahnella sp. BIGb0603]
MSRNRLKSRGYHFPGANKMRVPTVICPECGANSVIKKTARKHRKISDLYCACSDFECGHTFVMNMTFSHTISPSAKSQGSLLRGLVDSLKSDDKQMLLSLLQQA